MDTRGLIRHKQRKLQASLQNDDAKCVLSQRDSSPEAHAQLRMHNNYIDMIVEGVAMGESGKARGNAGMSLA
jgi:hypothetical protein